MIILALSASRFHRDRRDNVTDQLARPFIKTDYRQTRVIHSLIDIQNLFHMPNERRGDLAYAPMLLQVWLEFVFFRILFTVWCEMVSTNSSSTTLSAMRRKVQRLRPSGGSEQAKAVILAFWRPLILCGAPDRDCSLIAASRPLWTYLERTWRTVLRATRNDSIICVSVFPSLANSNMRQRVILRAFSVPLLMSCSNIFRSFGFNLTGFFTLIDTTSCLEVVSHKYQHLSRIYVTEY